MTTWAISRATSGFGPFSWRNSISIDHGPSRNERLPMWRSERNSTRLGRAERAIGRLTGTSGRCTDVTRAILPRSRGMERVSPTTSSGRNVSWAAGESLGTNSSAAPLSSSSWRIRWWCSEVCRTSRIIPITAALPSARPRSPIGRRPDSSGRPRRRRVSAVNREAKRRPYDSSGSRFAVGAMNPSSMRWKYPAGAWAGGAPTERTTGGGARATPPERPAPPGPSAERTISTVTNGEPRLAVSMSRRERSRGWGVARIIWRAPASTSLWWASKYATSCARTDPPARRPRGPAGRSRSTLRSRRRRNFGRPRGRALFQQLGRSGVEIGRYARYDSFA